jgi:TPR repeat protein
MYDLSLFLERLIGHRSQADEWLRRSAEARYPKAILKYALLLDQRSDEAGLERWLEWERAAGDSEHVLAFACQLAARRDMQGAQRWFRHAMEMGNVAAIRMLGDVKRSVGDLHGAAQYYQQSIDRGDIIAMYLLSFVYLKQDEPGKAEQMMRRMLDTRFDFRDRSEDEEDALGRAARELGLLLKSRDENEEAAHWFETATRYGIITNAKGDLARLMQKRDE